MSNGWIRLHREIEDWEFYFKEPFTYASAWIDLLLLASHKKSCFSIRGNLIEVKRGEIAWSEESLAKRWQWSRDKVRRYLTMLKTRQQIEQQKSFILNKIIILKYNQYQENDTADNTAEKQQTIQQKNTYNNDKKVKKVKEIKKVLGTDEPTTQIASLLLKDSFIKAKKDIYPMLQVEAEIRQCIDWHTTKGRVVRSWDRAISNWLKIAFERQGVVKEGQPNIDTTGFSEEKIAILKKGGFIK